MERAQLQTGERYGLRYVRTLGEPMLEVRMLEYVARSRKVKVEHLGGEHPGLIEYVRAGQLLCAWKDVKKWLRDEIHLKELRAANAARGLPSAPVREAVNLVFEAASEDIYMEQDGTCETRPDAYERVATRAGLSPDETSRLRAAPSFVDRSGNLFLCALSAVRLAQAFAGAEPDAVNLTIEAEKERYLAEGHLPGQRYMHELLIDRGPAFALARQWAGFDAHTELLQDEIKRLQGVIDEAVRAFRRAGDDRMAARLERALRGR